MKFIKCKGKLIQTESNRIIEPLPRASNKPLPRASNKALPLASNKPLARASFCEGNIVCLSEERI